MGSCIGRQTEVQINAIVPSKSFSQNNALLDKWNEQQVKLLSKKFNEFKTTEGLDFEGFEKLFKDCNYIPKSVIKNCFNQFALPGFSVMNFRNFCVLVAKIFLSNKKDKAELIFKIFSCGDDTKWTNEEKNMFNVSYKEYLKLIGRNAHTHFAGNAYIADFIEWAEKNIDFMYILKPFEMIQSPENEKNLIYNHINELKPREGLIICLVSNHWWDAWKNYVIYDRPTKLTNSFTKSISIGDRPVSIDNSHLLAVDSDIKLRLNLKEDKDFVVVDEKTWNLLLEWYSGGPKITRKYIYKSKKLILELYPPILTIIPVLNNGYPSNSNSKTIVFSLTNKFSEILEKAAKSLGKPIENSRIWVKSKGTWVIPNPIETLNQVKFTEEEVLFETSVNDKVKTYWPRDLVKDKLISFPSSTITASSSNSEDSKKPDLKKISYTRASKSPGIVGLINLGNTCYFNCIIQALVHTPLLQEFFASNSISSFLNKNISPEQSLSLEISNLSKEIWTGISQKVNPLKLFKCFTSKFPMFEDKEQHDCHEFLSMILEALHDELRREGSEEIKTTVILEDPEKNQLEISENGSSIQVEKNIDKKMGNYLVNISDNQWHMLQGTQGSIVSDICAGQTKTTLTCNICGCRRILFEIFTNLSLPIPIIISIPLYITIVPLFGSISKIGLMVSKHSKIKDIIENISNFSRIDIEKLSLIEGNISYSLTYLDLHLNVSLDHLGINKKTDLYAFETRKTIESCEELGRKARKHDSNLEVGAQVDIQHGEKWVTGKILEVKKNIITEYLVEYDYQTYTEWKTSSQIDLFRSKTSSSLCQPQQIILIHIINNGTRKIIGFPIILSIGNWYTFEDLHNLATSNAMRMCSKDAKNGQTCFRLLILDPIFLKCGICRIYSGCSGCPLFKSKTEVRNLTQSMKNVCVAVEWIESFFVEDVKCDSSVAQVKEKEKEINKPIDLNMCLDEFTKEENVDMQCEKCKGKNMKMKMEIWRVPDILILSLKRFTYSNRGAEKINNFVNYPFLGFEISQYVKSIENTSKVILNTSTSMNSYDLYAVVLHNGNMSGGHYTTLLKMQANWMLYDDDSTLKLNDSPENSTLVVSSYLLFYRRRRFSSSNVINLTYNSI
ncbi:hypothetical protein SteCoe_23822 [Stentor coeruleus]|uniref:Uncharacterized protein n=1 Tax=Stentor coeruleus TaxID=5963 RepID=A0A1R2BJ07_9CILI|nr:hypothetical protein SteCoe_23822 [Stentor coeruleus]